MKLQKAFFLVLGFAFLVSLGSLISGGFNQKAQVVDTGSTATSNTVSVRQPAAGAQVSIGQTLPMRCDLSIVPGVVVNRLEFSWYQYIPGSPTVAGIFTVVNNPGLQETRDVTIPNNPSIQDGDFTFHCVGYSSSLANTIQGTVVTSISAEEVPPPPPPPPPTPDTTIPTIPTNMSVTDRTSYTLKLNWTASTDNVGVAGYKIYRNNGGTTAINTTTPIAEVNGSTNSYTNVGLLSNRSYKYKIRAFDAAGNISGWATLPSSTTTTVTAATLAVQIPTNVTITEPTTSSLRINWTAPASGEIFNYAIYANAGGTTAINTTTPIATIPFGTNTYVHQNLSANTTYKYRVAAFDPANNRSALTTAKSGVTSVASIAAPSVPSGIAFSGATQSSLNISWGASTGASGQAIGYKIFRSPTLIGTYSQRTTDLTPAPVNGLISGLSVVNSNLYESTDYYYKIQACYTAIPTNCSAQSSAASGSTLAAPDTTAPTPVPTLTVGAITQNSVALSWTTSTDVSSPVTYKVFRNGTQVGSATSGTSITDSGLASGTTYSYTISACDSVGNCSAQSIARTATTLSAPAVPTGVSVGSPTTSSLTVSWSAVTGATSYRVYRMTSSGALDGAMPPFTVSAPALSTTFSGLTAGTSYYYSVSALNAVGESARSSVATGTTSAPQITISSIELVRTNGTVVEPLTGGEVINIGTQNGGLGSSISVKANTNPATAGSVVFSLQKPNSTTYTLTENTSPYTLFGDTGATTLNAWSDLQLGGYTLTVTPYAGANGTGQVGVPQTIQFLVQNNDDVTAPVNPTNVTVTYRSANQIKVAWTNSTSSDVSSYKVYRDGASVGFTDHPTNIFTDASVNASTVYGYKVTASDASGNEAALPGTSASSPILSTNFSINAQVRANANATGVRTSPESATEAGTQNLNAIGTITNGPVWIFGGVQYWYVDFTSGVDGWVNQDRLNNYVAPSTNGVSLTAPVESSNVVAGQTVPMTCAITTAPGAVVYQLVYTSWSSATGSVGLLTENNVSYTTGNQTRNVTIPANATGQYQMQCVAYFNAGGVYSQSSSSYYVNVTGGVVVDTTAPTVNITAPTQDQVLPVGTTSTTLTVATNEAATCKWSTSNVAYGSMTETFTGAGSTSHNYPLLGLTNGTTYIRHISCADTAGNASTTQARTFSVAAAISAPTVNITAPTQNQVLPAGTNSTTLTVTTSENATCKWSVSNVAYGSMTETFNGAGSTSHNYPLLGLTNGTSYTRYISCAGSTGVASTSTAITFSVSASVPPTGSGPVVTTPQRSLTPNQVAVVCNSQYSQSCQLADYYLAQRGIPTSNKVTVSIPTNDVITSSTFNNYNGTGLDLRDYVLSQIPSSDIQGAVLFWKTPYAVSSSSNTSGGACTPSSAACVSITHAFAKGGFVSGDTVSGASLPSISYFNTSSVKPKTDHDYLPTFILPFDSGNYTQGAGYVNQAVSADNTYPVGEFYMLSTADNARSGPRNTQMTSIENQFNQSNIGTTHYISPNFIANDPAYQQMGGCSHFGVQNGDYIRDKTNILGYFTGRLCVPDMAINTYLPGSIGDHLTSHGGDLAASAGQMPITEWLKRGVVASMGTIKEPWTSETYSQISEEFSNIEILLKEYYSGSSVLESYVKSVKKPANTLFVGEPLVNPWKDPQITFANNTLTINITHIKPGETWKLQSSTNGTSWTDVSGQTSITAPNSKFGIRVITVSNATAAYYRLVNNSSPSLPQIQRPVNGGVTPPPTSDTQVPTTPGNPTLSGSTSSSISFSWAASTDNVGVTEYRISRSGTQAGTYTQVGTSSVASYTNSGLNPSTTYWYKVSAVDAAGNISTSSAAVSFVTPSGSQQASVVGINGPVGPNNTENVTVGANPYGGTDYFVACSTGNDSNNGTSISTPWKTLSKLNSSTGSMPVGSRILFKRGETCYGTINAYKSGTQSAPIEYNAYGSGSAPIISGTDKITGTWTAHSGNIWKTTIAANLNPKYLFVNSDIQTVAKHPNTGWLTTASTTGSAITNSWIGTQTAGALTGATVVFRSSPWSWEAEVVSSHSGSSISFPASNYAGNLSNGSWANAGWGFAVKDKLSLLDTAGEWYYNKTSGELYFWAPASANPNSLNVSISTKDTGFSIGWQRTDVKVKNLVFEGFNLTGFFHPSGEGDMKRVVVENNEIRNTPTGIRMYTTNGNSSALANTIRNNYIHNIHSEGIYMQGGNGHLVEGNVLRDIGNDAMLGAKPEDWNFFGIRVVDGNSNYTLRRNTVENIGYIGIVAGGSGLITENIVSNPGDILNDGGGIAIDHTDGLSVTKNVIKNIGYDMSTMPALYQGYGPIANGFYFGDQNIKNTTVAENIITNVIGSGIWMDHSTTYTGNVVRDNIVHDFGQSGIGFSDYSNYKNTSCTAPSSNSACFMAQYNDVVTGNKIYATRASATPLTKLYVYSNGAGAVADFGTVDNNYYYNPFTTTKVKTTRNFGGGTNTYTFPQWLEASNEDDNSTYSNYTTTSANVAEIFYNETSSAITQTVNGCNANGTPLTGTQTIQPFRALVVEYGNC
jgi:uncharacterized protein (TIGR03790 family)